MSKLLSTTLLTLVCCATAHADLSTPQKEPVTSIQYDNRIAFFYPLHFSYERIKPDALYAGIEGYYLPVVNLKRFPFDGRPWLLDIEYRMGYNFFRGKDHVTPFAGLGYGQVFYDRYEFFDENPITHPKPSIVYGTVGVLYWHEFNTVFDLGLNVKLLYGTPISEKPLIGSSPVFGVDVALPMTFRFGRDRRWDFRIEPFDIYLKSSSSEHAHLFGFRNSIGYRF